jgi:hypothetical protein
MRKVQRLAEMSEILKHITSFNNFNDVHQVFLGNRLVLIPSFFR